MLSCLKATLLVEKKINIRLNLVQRIQLKMHTSVCKACATYEKQSEILNQVMLKFNGAELDQDQVDVLKSEILKKLNLS
jgi:hypothetical protein